MNQQNNKMKRKLSKIEFSHDTFATVSAGSVITIVFVIAFCLV